jgi:hypothetical protein
MEAQNVEWLRRCRDIAEHLSTRDSQEWALNPSGSHALLTSETGLELAIRRERRRVVITGWFGDMHNFVPRRLSADGWRYEPVSCRITEDDRKEARTIAVAIVRRLLPGYRAVFAETTARYAEHQRREQWERETVQALCSTYHGCSPRDQPNMFFITGHNRGVTGKGEASGIYGVHLELRNLSSEQARFILAYLEETRHLRHQPL